MTQRKVNTGTDQLLCVVEDGVAVIPLTRPQARNAMSDQLSPALRRMIRFCGVDADVGAVRVTGAGNTFCAGGDVKGMGDNRNGTPQSDQERIDDLQHRHGTAVLLPDERLRPGDLLLEDLGPGPAAGRPPRPEPRGPRRQSGRGGRCRRAAAAAAC